MATRQRRKTACYLNLWELSGKLGHSSVRRGDYRYFLRFPEEVAEEDQ
jgi:hypothetical protein